MIFVDHFTRYVWLYPLRKKSDVREVFIKFKAIVEKHLEINIKIFYSDNGGEFLTLTEFFSTNGIAHLTTPPHTPQHNGMSKRRHLYIIETGLTLLTHAFIPLTYWTYAFLIVEYLINRMPSLTYAISNLYEQIFHRQPNYLKLKVFRCLCYPWIKLYNSHKLESTSKLCVFLSYSNSQSAYFCLDPNTSRV